MSEDNTQPTGQEPEAGVQPTESGVEPQTENTTPTQKGGDAGEGSVSEQPGETPEGSSQPEAGVEGENPEQQPGENPEAPENPPVGNGEAPAEAGNVEPAVEEPVQPENGTTEAESAGSDEAERETDEDGQQIATVEETAELRSLEMKRKNMPISGDEVARIEYLNTLKHV